jgi:CBS-domain-containing membrane protein
MLLVHDISGLPVVDEAGHLLGVVSEADLISNEAYGYRRRRGLALVGEYLRDRDPQWLRKASGRSVAELMTAAPCSVTPENTAAFAARHMLEGRHKRLPVVEDDKVVGIVTRHDLLRQFYRPDADVLCDVQQLLADHHATASVSGGIVNLRGMTRFADDITLLETLVARVPGVVAVDNCLSTG